MIRRFLRSKCEVPNHLPCLLSKWMTVFVISFYQSNAFCDHFLASKVPKSVKWRLQSLFSLSFTLANNVCNFCRCTGKSELSLALFALILFLFSPYKYLGCSSCRTFPWLQGLFFGNFDSWFNQKGIHEGWRNCIMAIKRGLEAIWGLSRSRRFKWSDGFCDQFGVSQSDHKISRLLY